jgi:myo-inositol 2-dehydrogenase/D-chiro-inositol 1-dehydrogenase
METTLNLGLVGAGRIGRIHAEHVAGRIPAGRLLAVADVDETAARDCAQRLRIPAWTRDPATIFSDGQIQAVLICSSTDTHLDLIRAAAAAGKHVFCEKPLDTDLSRIDQAVAAVRQAGVILQVGFNRRFDASFRRIRDAVAGGQIGSAHQIRITSRDPAPPPIEYVRRSGGIFLDMTIHDFDMARFLAGSEVEEIYATGAVRIDPAIGAAGDLDTATMLLKFASGAVGVIENSRRAVFGYDQRVEVFGSNGMIAADNVFPNTATLWGSSTVHRDLPLNFFMDRYRESYLEELRAFLDAVRTSGASPVSGEEARRPVAMALAARRSHELNRPVRLAEIG